MNATISSDRVPALTGTIVFHATLIALLFLMKCGGGGGGNGGLGYTGLMSMDVAGMGNDIEGWGDQPDAEAPVEESQVQPIVEDNTSAISDNSDVPEAPSVNNKPNEKPHTTPKDTHTKPTTETKPQQVSGNLNNAFGQLSKGGNGNTSGGGNQGTADGKIDGKGIVSGGGSQGTGGGQGGGNGTGNGPRNGPGSGPGSGGLSSNYSLTGRSLSRKPTLSETAPDEGVVVVDIWVDQNGNVTKAVANPAKSTSSNGQLYKLAEKAAKNAKFSAGGSNEQKGTITITFKLH